MAGEQKLEANLILQKDLTEELPADCENVDDLW